jgi:ABC-type transport system substrate-binding protein
MLADWAVHFRTRAGSAACSRASRRQSIAWKDPSTQLLALQRGDIDIARNLGADQLKSLTGNANFHTVSAPQGTSMYFAMNQAMPELAKKEVQQASKSG